MAGNKLQEFRKQELLKLPMLKRKQDLQPVGGSRRRANRSPVPKPMAEADVPKPKPKPMPRLTKGTAAAANRMMPVKEEVVEAEVLDEEEEMQVEEPRRRNITVIEQRKLLEELRQKLQENEGLQRRLVRTEAAEEKKKWNSSKA